MVTGTERYLTYAQQLTVITPGDVLTSFTFTSGSYSPIYDTKSVATTIVSTITTLLGPGPDTDPNGAVPGEICGGVCGACNIFFPSVSVYYWPVTSQNTACLAGNSAAASSAAVSLTARAVDAYPRGLEAHPRALNGNESILVLDGFTLLVASKQVAPDLIIMLMDSISTSPSAYIAFPTISAADMCDTVGSIYTDITLAVAPGQLSTVVGQSTFEFNFADALCPPTSVAEVDHISFIGQGYRPVIAPFPGITEIDEQWVSCGAADFQGDDPPSALVPKSNLSPFTTPSDTPAKPTAASPSSSIPAIPAQTTQAVVTTKNASPSTEPKSSNDPGSDSVQLSTQNTPSQSIAGPDGPTQTQVSEDSGDLTHSPVTATAIDPAGPSSNDPASQVIQTPIASGDTYSSSHSPVVIPIVGQSFTANSESALVAGTITLTPGGPAVTISNTPVSLASSAGFLVVADGTSTMDLNPSTITPVTVQDFTFGGQTYTADSASDFVIGSQTLTRGASAITVSGTLMSLAPAGTDVVIGTSTQGVGGLIMSGFAGGNPANYTVNPFRGAAARNLDDMKRLMLLIMGSVTVGLLGGYWIL